ncbi:MAG: response regulator [Pirellulales bacterium]|nr:response regulator [Pirellulales bacterium]
MNVPPTDRPVVSIVDDELSVLRSIEYALASLGAQIEAHTSAEDFLRTYRRGRIACLLVDYVLPGVSGLELIEKLTDDPGLQIVMISGRGTIASAVSAMKSGAIEYLEKPYTADSLQSAVTTALRRHQAFRKKQVKVEARQKRLETLSDEEKAVIAASATGDTVKEIAARLDISVRTVHMRLSSAMKKTQTQNKIELIKLACCQPQPATESDQAQVPVTDRRLDSASE